MDRRKFIANAAALSSFMILPRHVLGGKGFIAPSDRVNLGFIGCGRQAFNLQQNFLPIPEARIIAACDVYKSKLDAFTFTVSQHYKLQNSCEAYHNFTDLLHNKDVDAVVIAVPDHWHAAIAVRAAAAGKDIYCEKPLSLTVAEGRAMVKAAEKHKRVFQTGSMQRSQSEFRQAVELIRSGQLGEIKQVKVSVGGPPIPYNLPEETMPTGLDWELWLGPNEYVHYNHELNPIRGDKLWGRWRDFKGLGGGDVTDWGAHMFDIVQMALGTDHTGPVSFIPPNGKDIQYLTMQYANGIVMTHEDFGKPRGIQFTGTNGKLEIQRHKLVTMPELPLPELSEQASHYLNFLQCIKTRQQPIASVETGHRSATICNLVNIAYELNSPLTWDPVKEKITNNKKANRLLSRAMKPEWAV